MLFPRIVQCALAPPKGLASEAVNVMGTMSDYTSIEGALVSECILKIEGGSMLLGRDGSFDQEMRFAVEQGFCFVLYGNFEELKRLCPIGERYLW
jgi:hypothetical protein